MGGSTLLTRFLWGKGGIEQKPSILQLSSWVAIHINHKHLPITEIIAKQRLFSDKHCLT